MCGAPGAAAVCQLSLISQTCLASAAKEAAGGRGPVHVHAAEVTGGRGGGVRRETAVLLKRLLEVTLKRCLCDMKMMQTDDGVGNTMR